MRTQGGRGALSTRRKQKEETGGGWERVSRERFGVFTDEKGEKWGTLELL